ncbi:hypothetical protein ACRAWF_45970 [Streptomyces sp. L7]
MCSSQATGTVAWTVCGSGGDGSQGIPEADAPRETVGVEVTAVLSRRPPQLLVVAALVRGRGAVRVRDIGMDSQPGQHLADRGGLALSECLTVGPVNDDVPHGHRRHAAHCRRTQAIRSGGRRTDRRPWTLRLGRVVARP